LISGSQIFFNLPINSKILLFVISSTVCISAAPAKSSCISFDLILSNEIFFDSIIFSSSWAGFDPALFSADFLRGPLELLLEVPPISSCPTTLILRKFLTHLTKALFSAVAAKKLEAKLYVLSMCASAKAEKESVSMLVS